MPHDILFNQLQKRKTEPAQVKTAIDNFEKCIVDVRNKIDDIINEAKSICTEPQDNTGEYCDKLETTCLAYPELEKSRLKTELCHTNQNKQKVYMQKIPQKPYEE
ncbi:unnamed protein product [Acanthoscelides obtectus]|uniref:Uncharacterized protein n=1 Tax=Acanthoscelides obtectus TaxID=200917 RepID=A0A9P0LRK8_ACAOB|nr:unnamed protein product [Acanthoscelides obtectus]CAK1670732.1 hypothetical protein AOBTE_LOCUS27796 [Acanthoscelides obtectus]